MSTPPSGPGGPGANPPPGGQFQSVFGQGAAQPPQQPPYPPPPPQGPWQPQAAPPPMQRKKGLGPIAWVLIILGGLFACFIILLVAGGLFVMHKAKQAGLDPGLMRRNPAMAIAKLGLARNPDYEIVDENDDRGTMKIRDRHTGEVLTMDAGDIRNGQLTFRNDQGHKVTFSASGAGNGTFDIHSDQGTAHFGGGAVHLPSWLPSYPGSVPETSVSAENNEGTGAAFSFKTSDDPDKVMAYYKDAFQRAGLKESANIGTGGLNMVAVADENNKRQATVTVTSSDGSNTVNVTFKDNK